MPPLDLLSWPELEAARAEVDRAHEDYQKAFRGLQRAYKGIRRERIKALGAAHLNLMKAELKLAEIEADR